MSDLYFSPAGENTGKVSSDFLTRVFYSFCVTFKALFHYWGSVRLHGSKDNT